MECNDSLNPVTAHWISAPLETNTLSIDWL